MTYTPYYRQSVPSIPLPQPIESGQTTITGWVKDSGNQLIPNGWIEFTSDDILVDGAVGTRTMIVSKPARFPINGELNIRLNNSIYSNSTYRVRVGETVTITTDDGNFEQDIIYSDFHTSIPYGASVDISDLVPVDMSRNDENMTILRLANLIIESPSIRSKFLSNLFNLRGNWQPNTQYYPFDVVTVNGNSTYIARDNHLSGATFLATNWQRLV